MTVFKWKSDDSSRGLGNRILYSVLSNSLIWEHKWKHKKAKCLISQMGLAWFVDCTWGKENWMNLHNSHWNIQLHDVFAFVTNQLTPACQTHFLMWLHRSNWVLYLFKPNFSHLWFSVFQYLGQFVFDEVIDVRWKHGSKNIFQKKKEEGEKNTSHLKAIH